MKKYFFLKILLLTLITIKNVNRGNEFLNSFLKKSGENVSNIFFFSSSVVIVYFYIYPKILKPKIANYGLKFKNFVEKLTKSLNLSKISLQLK